MRVTKIISLILIFNCLFVNLAWASDAKARTIVKKAWDYWRDKSSFAVAKMIVHRSDWERRFSLKVWTKGTDHSLVFFTAPAKDAGTGSLTVGDQVWTYSPKINRIMKIPPSMKSQSWMGSDFSYQDLSRSSEIVDQYDHVLINEDSIDGKKVYYIKSIPHETAPVVWGREELKIREDNIILEHLFYDQDDKLIKKIEAKEIKMLGGKLFPVVMRVVQLEKNDEWTEVTHLEAKFDIEIEDRLFTQAGLTNPEALVKN